MPPWSPNAEEAQEMEDSYYGFFFNEIKDEYHDFERHVAVLYRPLRCSVIKVVFDSRDKVYFIRTGRIQHHYVFLANGGYDGPKETRSLAEFNDVVYSGKDRSLICATIVRYPSAQNKGCEWTIEMVPTDPLEPSNSDRVALAFKKIQENFKCGSLSFRPTSFTQAENVAKPEHPLGTFPRVDTSAVFQNQTYGAYTIGQVMGVIKIIANANDAAELEKLSHDDIVFIKKGIPNDLPPVAGVVFAEPLPPLCHVALLCNNRGTPCCFDSKEATEKQFRSSKGSHQILRVYDSGCDVISTYYSASNTKIEARQVTLSEPDANQVDPILFSSCGDQVPSVAQIGAKARRCFEINRALEQDALHSKCFVIPIGAFMRHVQDCSIKTHLHHLSQAFPIPKTARSSGAASIKSVREFTDKIRASLMRPAVSHDVLSAVSEQIKLLGVSEVILRSSTNAEDIEGFNAAGLYESKTLSVASMTDDALSDAIKTIWASVWSPKAFLERYHFGIDSRQVGMAILVQPYFNKDEIAANGVAVTFNPLNRQKYGVFTTAYPGGAHRATDVVQGMQPERSMVHLSRVVGKFDVELIRTASGPGIDSTKPACDPTILEQLGKKCSLLHQQILGVDISTGVDSKTVIDVEWLLLKEGNQLIVIQARPCGTFIVGGC